MSGALPVATPLAEQAAAEQGDIKLLETFVRNERVLIGGVGRGPFWHLLR
jgi:hypothetical protein